MPTLHGLHFLAISVLCSVSVSALLKLAARHRIDMHQAVAANYAVATLLCWLTLSPDPRQLLTPQFPWLALAALGLLLPCGILAMAAAVRHAGIVRTDAAQRLSIFIPLLAAFALFGEAMTARKGFALLVAACALYCLLRPGAADRDAAPAASRAAWLWPALVWAIYGTVDILFKQLARSGASFAGTLLLAFGLAGALMLVYLLVRRAPLQPRHWIAGAALGLGNFCNIYTYIRAHQLLSDRPSLVFASMNMGVIALGTVVGAVFFREALTRWSVAGIALALAAVALMVPG